MIPKTHQKPLVLYAWLALLVGLLFITSMFIGPSTLSIKAVWAALTAPDQSPSTIIVSQIRLPRTILATLVGATLGLAGATLQGLLRNPLAEPGIIGASSGAALGAALVLYFGLAEISIVVLPIAGMIFALVAVAILFLLVGRNASPLALILSGVAISSFASALTALAINLASSAYAALEITFWLMGSLTDRSMTHVALAAPAMVVGWVLMLSGSRSLSVLSLGEDTALSLGVSLNSLRIRLVLGIAISVGAAVSISGAIGFVGLIVPHILRPLVGFEPGRLLGVSMLGGSALVIAADIAVRLLSTGIEIRLGVVTALIGVPFFLFLLLKLRRETI